MKLLGQNISDFVRLYQDTCARNIVLQQQLDDSNAKLLTQFEIQNTKILELEDQRKNEKAVSDFYREQAMKAGVIPFLRRSRTISSSDEHLTPEQLSK